MRPLKVVLFIDSLVSGGAQRQLVELAVNIDKNRYIPVVYIYHDIQELRFELDKAGIRVVLIKKRGKIDLRFLAELVRLLRKEKPDIIHSYLNNANFWARLAGTMATVPHIITSERNIDIQFSMARVLIERVLHRLSSVIVVNAVAIKDILVGKLGIEPERVRVIYNGVDMEKFSHPDPEAVLRLKRLINYVDGQYIMTLPGRMAPQKNHLCLIRAIEPLLSEGSNIKIIFVGNETDLEYKKILLAEIHNRSLSEYFVFAGRQDDMAAVYAVSDIIVLPSLWEGLPNVVLEAMSAGRPVIASDVADNARIIKHDVNGYLFPSNDVLELTNCIAKTMHMDKENLSKMGEAGREFVRTDFAMVRMVQSFQNIYDTVAGV